MNIIIFIIFVNSFNDIDIVNIDIVNIDIVNIDIFVACVNR